jgi:hypothetical protein
VAWSPPLKLWQLRMTSGICEGRCCRGIWVGLWLGNSGGMVQAVGGGLKDFWGLECRVVAVVVEVVGNIDYVVAMMAVYEGCH